LVKLAAPWLVKAKWGHPPRRPRNGIPTEDDGGIELTTQIEKNPDCRSYNPSAAMVGGFSVAAPSG
jgi:hypothetical protein